MCTVPAGHMRNQPMLHCSQIPIPHCRMSFSVGILVLFLLSSREMARRIASTVPEMFSQIDQVSIRCRAARPRSASKMGSARATFNNSARALTFPHGYMNEGFIGAIRSCAAPTRSLAITGHPQHDASFTTTQNASYSDGRTMRSEAVYMEGSCD